MFPFSTVFHLSSRSHRQTHYTINRWREGKKNINYRQKLGAFGNTLNISKKHTVAHSIESLPARNLCSFWKTARANASFQASLRIPSCQFFFLSSHFMIIIIIIFSFCFDFCFGFFFFFLQTTIWRSTFHLKMMHCN